MGIKVNTRDVDPLAKAMKKMWALSKKFFMGLTKIILPIVVIYKAIKSFLEGFASAEEWKSMALAVVDELKNGEGIVGNVFRTVTTLFKKILEGWKLLGALYRDILNDVDPSNVNSRTNKVLGKSNVKEVKAIEITPSAQLTKDSYNENRMGSLTTVAPFRKEFNDMISAHTEYIAQLMQAKNSLVGQLKNTTDIKVIEKLQNQLAGWTDEFTGRERLLGRSMDDFMQKFNNLSEDIKKTNIWKDTSDMMASAMKNIGRVSEDLNSELSKTSDVMNKVADTVSKITEKNKEYMDLQKQTSDLIEETAKSRKSLIDSLASGLGFSGAIILKKLKELFY